MSNLKRFVIFIVPLFFFCLDINKSLLADPQLYSYDFPGRTQDVIFTVASAVLAQYGYTVAVSDRAAGIIRTAELYIPLRESDCECAAVGEIPYSKKQKTITHFSFTLTVFGHGATIATTITREYLPDDPAYGTKFICVSRGTIENDVYSKIAAALSSTF